MVRLDHGLIRRARALITYANLQRGKGIIFAYEQAVQLHNDGRAGHVVYQAQHENELREFTQREAQNRAAWMDELEESSNDAIQRATAVMKSSQRLHELCEDLDAHVRDALLFGYALPGGVSNGNKARK